MRVTVKHLALMLQVEYNTASQFMKVLETYGAAKKTGEKVYGIAKASNVYEVEDSLNIDLKTLYAGVPELIIPDQKQAPKKVREVKPKPEPILNEAGEVVKRGRGRPKKLPVLVAHVHEVKQEADLQEAVEVATNPLISEVAI